MIGDTCSDPILRITVLIVKSMCAINDPLHKLILLVLLLLLWIFKRHFGFFFFFFYIQAHCPLLTHVRGPVSLILKLEIHDPRYVL